MRKRRLLVTAALISAIVILPVAVSLGIVDVPKLPFLGSTATPLGNP